MYHLKFLRSNCVRSAMIPAALCVILSGCAEQQPTDPGIKSTGPDEPRVARVDNIPFNKFFVAWSQGYSGGPIHTQIFGLDARQDRQYGGWWAEQDVLDFASANRGRLYIHGDEPDQWCIAPYEYAGMYKNFVTRIRTADPTARFSPAGLAEPNVKCCPPDDEECKARMHSISYAQQFYDAYVARYGEAPPVAEWRFHDFGVAFAAGDLDSWWSRVDKAAAWSVAHGANMILGGWGFHGWRDPVPVFQEHMKQAMGRLISDSRINGAAYWSYEQWVESPRPLVHEGGSLTEVGKTYANPLTDTPTAPKIVGSSDGFARLRWNNTTSAWGAEVEFWVQAPGSDSFTYGKTERVAAPGATQTPFVSFNIGESVRARVRYYNAYGVAEWSPFSNIVSLALEQPEDDHRKKRGKSPLFCFLQFC